MNRIAAVTLLAAALGIGLSDIRQASNPFNGTEVSASEAAQVLGGCISGNYEAYNCGTGCPTNMRFLNEAGNKQEVPWTCGGGVVCAAQGGPGDPGCGTGGAN